MTYSLVKYKFKYIEEKYILWTQVRLKWEKLKQNNGNSVVMSDNQFWREKTKG